MPVHARQYPDQHCERFLFRQDVDCGCFTAFFEKVSICLFRIIGDVQNCEHKFRERRQDGDSGRCKNGGDAETESES